MRNWLIIFGINVLYLGSFSTAWSADIVVTPEKVTALSCSEIEFEVANVSVGEVYQINVPSSYKIISEDLLSQGGNFIFPKGSKLKFNIKSDVYNNAPITVEVVNLNTQKVVKTISVDFYPFVFFAPEQNIIAGKQVTVPIDVKGCDKNNKLIKIKYTGKPEVIRRIKQPENGGDYATFVFEPIFNNGKPKSGTDKLLYFNSGEVEVTLNDPNFDCTDLWGCPRGNKYDLTGSFTVRSRPWTFAICDENGKNLPNGTSRNGGKFLAAGREFNLQVKPIVWGKEDLGHDEVDVSLLCSHITTSNFYLDSTPEEILELTSELASPINGRFVNGLQSSGPLSIEHKQMGGSIYNQYYLFRDLKWNEVGSLKVKVKAKEKYLGMDINTGYINLGRFYPAGFKNISNNWFYRDGLNTFAYMDQPIAAKIEVGAVNADGELVENYGLSDYKFRSDLKLIAVDGSNRLIDDRFFYTNRDSGWENRATRGKNQRSAKFIIDTYDFKFLKNVIETNPKTTRQDGPFNTNTAQFGMMVSSAQDGVDSMVMVVNDNATLGDPAAQEKMIDVSIGENQQAIGLELKNQPDFRYGRMTLDNVSGAAGGPISIPLRVEYWDGNAFVVNTKDNGTFFKASEFYAFVDTSAILQDSMRNERAKVSEGLSSRIVSVQKMPQKESVRLFLRQDNDSFKQPWLKYNWRDKGDEDPSTLVTFGSYRGNDRVIFRGETDFMTSRSTSN
ncbi:MAG: DUF6701 domain-containing protein [Vibrio sp.]